MMMTMMMIMIMMMMMILMMMMAAPFSKHSPLRNMMRRITIMSVMVMICFTKAASSRLNLRKKKIDIGCWGCNGSNNRDDNENEDDG